MARFNQPPVGTATVNLAQGQAYTQSPELEFVSILLTSFASDAFYRSANDTMTRLKQLASQLPTEFVAKALIFARHEYGMRSITHVMASEIGKRISGTTFGTAFYDKIIKRVDDITEIISYHMSKKEKISNAMRKGLGKALGRQDAYSLAKYRAGNKEVKLVDVVNLIHPKKTEKAVEAIIALTKNDLKSSGTTWEAVLSAAGTEGASDEDKVEAKAAAWSTLVNEGKLAQFALLRNLRNIIETAPEVLPKALEQLVNPERIKKSLIFPFRYYSAYKEIEKLNSGPQVRMTMVALSKAIDISCSTLPEFTGTTCILIDVSASMSSASAKLSEKSTQKVSDIAAVFGAVMTKAFNADVIQFHGEAKYLNFNPLDSTMTIATGMRFNGGSTSFPAAIRCMNKKYDRIIILSDMQGWDDNLINYGNTGGNPKEAFRAYKQLTGANPKVYSFDLAGYGTLQFPERNVYCLAGFSDKTLSIMSYLEKDKDALINQVRAISL